MRSRRFRRSLSAADTFADSSRPDNGGDCLTKASACKTIGGVDGAIAKASAGSTVHVEPGTYAENVALSGGISLVADSGNPTIAPTVGVALTVTGGPAVTIQGLTFSSNVAAGFCGSASCLAVYPDTVIRKG